MEENKEIKTDLHEEQEHHEKKSEKKNKHKEQVEALEKEIKELKDKWLRSIAELENFKKRMTQERILDRKYASKNLINDLLVPLEQMNKAVEMKTDNEH